MVEDEVFLRLYLRMVMSMVSEMLLFQVHYMTPPWSFCLALSDDTDIRNAGLNKMEKDLELLHELEYRNTKTSAEHSERLIF